MESEFKLREIIKNAYHSGETHACMPSEMPEKVEHHDKAGIYEYVTPIATFKLSASETKYLESDIAVTRDKALECWIRYLAKETGKEVTDEYVQYCIDSWHETMERLGIK